MNADAAYARDMLAPMTAYDARMWLKERGEPPQGWRVSDKLNREGACEYGVHWMWVGGTVNDGRWYFFLIRE